MIHTVNAAKALETRRTVKPAATGIEHWSTDFIGAR
ncbi:MAG: hypothetical protein QOK44_2975 [Betaproteobacteria bacterium]|jgi:hypothetical protein|nr:hypothetical protein [Betaproteobacteria bacterium]